ncbi:MAG: hypothetical protein LBB39_02410 [Mycoplasmataceae bacterium]|jgi:hypothetical protein|nr:hypothetical protein [Mycoplasmataceae bacterium]
MSRIRIIIIALISSILIIFGILAFVNVDKVGFSQIILYESKEYIILNKEEASKSLLNESKKYEVCINDKYYQIQFENYDEIIKDPNIDYSLYKLKPSYTKNLNTIESDFKTNEILSNCRIIYGKEPFFYFIFS